MNRIYALIWSRSKRTWVVASELTRTCGKVSARVRVRGIVRLLLLATSALICSVSALAQQVINGSTTTESLDSSTSYQLNTGQTATTSTLDNAININGIAPVTFTNFGRVLGTATGFSGIAFNTTGSLINEASGLIHGTTYAVWLGGDGANNNLLNRGDISASTNHAVNYTGNLSGTIDNYGTINGGAAGTVGNFTHGIELNTSGAMVINNHAGSSIRTGMNDTSYGFGIESAADHQLKLLNEGSIIANQSAVSVHGSGSETQLINSEEGVLTGTRNVAVYLVSNSIVRNAGTISSPLGAITFAGSNNTLVLESTSSITGNVLGGTDGTLALGGSAAGSFDMGQLGPTKQYRDFSLFDKQDAGTWTLTGSSNSNWSVTNGTLILADGASLTGGALTILPGGTFQYGQGGTGSIFGGTFVNNGMLVFNQGGATSLNTQISGAGAVVLRTGEDLAYAADTSYTGTTTIDSGATLRVGTGGTTGAVVGGIVDNGSLVFNRSNAVTYSGDISGSGSFRHSGTGPLTITGTNSFTGGTTIDSGGTLQVGAGGATGSLVGNIENNGTLIADRTGSLNFDGVISGTGDLIKRGAGTLQLSGTNTYVGQTRLEGGVLAATSAENFGTLGNGLTFDGGTLRWLNAFFIGRPAELLAGGGALDSNDLSVEWRSLTTGVGKLSKTGQGTVVITADNTYSGGTSILGGTLQLGNGGTTGSVVGDISNDGTLAFNHSDDVTFSNLISGTGSVTQSGPGSLLFTSDLTYTGGTTIAGGRLTLGNGGTSGRVAGNVINNGQLLVNRSDNVSDVAGLISGSGTFTKLGAGTLTFTRNHLYTGSTTVSAGTLRIGNGGTAGGIRGNVINNATLIHDRSDVVTFGSSLSGSGTFLKNGSGTLKMTADNPFSGTTQLNGGITLVDGSLDGSVQVNSGATLGGTGTLGGEVTISNGGHLSPGDSPGSIIVDSLVLNSTSQLDYELGLPNVVGGGVNDLTDVIGDLTLDGVLNITDVGGFGNGVYRLFSYGGTLTDNGMLFGSLPLGFANSDLLLQTSVVSEVNLIVSQGGLSVQFWDGPNTSSNGVIDGGTSTWNTLNTRWTSSAGDVNAPWQNGFAVFQGTAGTVTLGENITLTGAQFLTDGYVIQGGAFNLHSDANTLPVRVDAGVTATLNAAIGDGSAGATKLIKRDAGTLILGGTNTYTGGTAVEEGRIQVSSDANLGGTAGGVELDNGGLNTTASFTTNRSLLLSTGFGVLAPSAATTLTWAGVISGAGGLDKQSTGTLILTGANTYAGDTRIIGTLQLGNGGASGSLTGNVLNNGSLVINRSDAISLDGVISGSGSVIQQGGGTTTLASVNTYAGGTSVNGGVLSVNADNQLGAAAGSVAFDGGTLRVGPAFSTSRAMTLNSGGGTLDTSDTATLAGVLSGAGALTIVGAGTAILSATNTYAGGTFISAGTLQLGGGGTSGSLLGDVANNSALVFNRSNAYSYAGIISGNGEVSVIGGGSLTLGGINTFANANGFQVRSGSTLVIGSNANLGAASNRLLLRNASTLRVTSTFAIDRSVVLEGAGSFNHVDTQANTTTLSGVLSGDAGLQKEGSGSLLLTANNTYTGGAPT